MALKEVRYSGFRGAVIKLAPSAALLVALAAPPSWLNCFVWAAADDFLAKEILPYFHFHIAKNFASALAKDGLSRKKDF